MADQLIQIGAANREVVKRLMLHLTAAFEEFAEREFDRSGGLAYMDALMGFHNAYKAMILDLEKRVGDECGLIRATAVTTLEAALNVKATPAAQHVASLLRQVMECCGNAVDDPLLLEKIKGVLSAN